jgi:hypothetical protein
MKKHFQCSLLVSTIFLNGCTTAQLWGGGIQDDYVKVVPKDIHNDVEISLKNQNRVYYCKTFSYASPPKNKVCYMKYTDAEKLNDLKIKLYKTPEKLVTDAGLTVLFVGYMVIGGMPQTAHGR